MAMQIRHNIYNALVNRKPGISFRYHRVHDDSEGVQRLLSWGYLLWLNFGYYILCLRFIGRLPQAEFYEEKRLNVKQSESIAFLKEHPELSAEAFLAQLEAYDVVSFDMFDTLVFRPFDKPTDLFHLIGEKMCFPDFCRLRIRAEAEARMEHREKHGNMEVCLDEIWKRLEEILGDAAENGAALEQELELEYCYGNPFLRKVWVELLKRQKKLVITTDMYLPEECIKRILEKTGFTGYSAIYLSNCLQRSKAGGELFGQLQKEWKGYALIHVGDNPHSDVKMALDAGCRVLPYPGINRNVLSYRAQDMSCLVGSAYRAVVSARLYCGLGPYSMEYEYGFVYGGLFVLGYCHFIHEYCKNHGIDKILFLSRDGDTLKQAYDFLYPDEHTEYVFWSRKAAAKLLAQENRYDYFRRFILHKADGKYTIAEILHSMELDILTQFLQENQNQNHYRNLNQNPEYRKAFHELDPTDRLTVGNCRLLQDFVEVNWDVVANEYAGQQDAAKAYYQSILGNAKKAAAVDIGWAGSGALALSLLAEKVWDIPCRITGIIAGTNTIHNAEANASEAFLQSGRLVSYLYSQSHNRDILKKHDPAKDYNVFWELLLSSPTPQFEGFYKGRPGLAEWNLELCELPENALIGLPGKEIALGFGKKDANQAGIREIQRGILDFVRDYHGHFKKAPYMCRISGRDAYAPMLVAASRKERYLKAIKEKFGLEINVV